MTVAAHPVAAREIAVASADGHRWQGIARIPAAPRAGLLWLPAMGIPARHYLPFADALAARGIAVCLHEWRGAGSSNLRAGRDADWGYRELLDFDLPAAQAVWTDALPAGLSRIVGGHSLGGQLACCHLGLHPQAADALWLVASGAPYWRAFPPPHRYWLPLVYRFLPWLARRVGHLPGRRLGFGGNEARSLIRDWAGTALRGRYAAPGVAPDLDQRLSDVTVPTRALVLSDDWLGPASSMRFLLSKLGAADVRLAEFDATAAGTRPDHYAWMKRPGPVVDWLLADAPPSAQPGA